MYETFFFFSYSSSKPLKDEENALQILLGQAVLSLNSTNKIRNEVELSAWFIAAIGYHSHQKNIIKTYPGQTFPECHGRRRARYLEELYLLHAVHTSEVPLEFKRNVC